MLASEVEKKLANYLSLGTLFVTVFILANTNTDPVNVTKLFVMGGVGVSVLAIAIIFGRNFLFEKFRFVLLLIGFFIFFMFVASFASASSFSQNYFGEYGRNNGLLTYALFSAILISALLVARTASFEKIFYSLFGAGLINVAYCAWVLAFGDFIPWNNPYGNILGLFGNPDFISAFLGMFIAGSLAFVVSGKTNRLIKAVLVLASLLALLEILKSHAIQGLVVTAGGITIIGFYLLRSKFENRFVPIIYAGFVTAIAVVAVFGTLQKGPLSFVYKRSVSLRGSYWRAGIEMGNSRPFTGVGMDTYGEWYRRARPPVALIDTPGINTLSNVSHNVVIDFFASGGYPLLISYLAIIALGAISILRVTWRKREYDSVFVGLTSVWLCYQVQSFVSINQIGLAIWGWLFTGLLVAYEYSTRDEFAHNPSLSKSKKENKKVQSNIISPKLVAGIGLIIGLLITMPPFLADSKWLTALRSSDAAKVEAALTPSYFNPADSYRYAQAVNLFQTSNLLDLAHKYALAAVEFNPDYFDAWKQLYLLPNTSGTEKNLALSNMKRLDPMNPDVTASQ